MNVPALRKPLLLTSLFAALLLPVAAQAQSWPSRPVKIIVPFAPGGTADLFGRIAAEHLSKELGQQFVIENRGGAGGLTGSAARRAGRSGRLHAADLRHPDAGGRAGREHTIRRSIRCATSRMSPISAACRSP